ncbi:hypothetical protein MishRS11D_27010 [Methylomagnum ishizawai]|nr:hypothetical protein MishRS11D_27010 [Methylomagnum ishizawai]
MGRVKDRARSDQDSGGAEPQARRWPQVVRIGSESDYDLPPEGRAFLDETDGRRRCGDCARLVNEQCMASDYMGWPYYSRERPNPDILRHCPFKCFVEREE